MKSRTVAGPIAGERTRSSSRHRLRFRSGAPSRLPAAVISRGDRPFARFFAHRDAIPIPRRGEGPTTRRSLVTNRAIKFNSRTADYASAQAARNAAAMREMSSDAWSTDAIEVK